MTAIDVTNSHKGLQQNGFPRSDAAGKLRADGIPQVVIDQAVARGRRLRSEAVGHAFSGLVHWTVATVRAAIGRRASNRLGCGECGDMMRA